MKGIVRRGGEVTRFERMVSGKCAWGRGECVRVEEVYERDEGRVRKRGRGRGVREKGRVCERRNSFNKCRRVLTHDKYAPSL